MTAELVYLAKFLKLSTKYKNYTNFLKKKFSKERKRFLILGRASHVAQSSETPLPRVF